MNIYCNPINISYKYQHMRGCKNTFREGADATLIYFKDKYYLFVSMCGGFYYSDNMLDWKYHKNEKLEIFSYAPDVSTDGKYMYFTASERLKKSKIYRTENPFGEFELVSSPFPFWDPNIYFEDGKQYLFWGCSNRTPIYVRQLDKNMMPVSKKNRLIYGNPKEHGTERKDMYIIDSKNTGEKFINTILGTAPFIEGAYLNKLGDKYYLQYACPGTEYPTYGDCVYTSDNIMDGYIFQKHNPYSIVPSGFVTGAGHGSTIEDKYGNLWHSSSMCVCVNHSYERRVGIWCAGVDKDGILFCNQSFADYPKEIPDGKFDPMSIQPKWMLLSYKKFASASSTKTGYPVKNAVDESIKTSWCSASSKQGEWFCVDLGESMTVGAVQLNFADVETKSKKLKASQYKGTFPFKRYIDLSDKIKSRWILFGSNDNERWDIIKDNSKSNDALCHDLVVLEKETKYRYLKIDFIEFSYNQCFALSGFRVFGIGNGDKPEKVKNVQANRISDTEGKIKWDKVDNAQGYNVHIGIAPDKLYNSILVHEDTQFNVTFLNKGTKQYYYSVDSFNENGITQGEICKMR